MSRNSTMHQLPIDPSSCSSITGICTAETVVQGAEVSSQAVEDLTATADIGSAAPADAGLKAEAAQTDADMQIELAGLQQESVDVTALDSSDVCTGEDSTVDDSSSADPHSSAAGAAAAQQELQQHHESLLQPAAARTDAVEAPAESTAAAMVLQMAADMLQAAEAAAAQAVEFAAANPAVAQPASAAADAVAAAAGAAETEDAAVAAAQQAEAAALLFVDEAVVPAAVVAAAAPVIAVLGDPAAEEHGSSAIAAVLDGEALAALDNPQQQQQQQQHLEPAGLPSTMLESVAAVPAATAESAEAPLQPLWPPGVVYLTPWMAQWLNELGGCFPSKGGLCLLTQGYCQDTECAVTTCEARRRVRDRNAAVHSLCRSVLQNVAAVACRLVAAVSSPGCGVRSRSCSWQATEVGGRQGEKSTRLFLQLAYVHSHVCLDSLSVHLWKDQLALLLKHISFSRAHIDRQGHL
jgi:hypothetical protein